MVDIETRRKSAEIARRFVAGQISNFEFENEFPCSKDPAISAIEDTLWCFYDDFKEHKLKGEHSIPKETKKLMLRWVLFLYTDSEYKWPNISYPGIRPIEYGFFGRLFNRDKKQHDFLSSGQIDYWPFINSESYQLAKNNPVLFGGGT